LAVQFDYLYQVDRMYLVVHIVSSACVWNGVDRVVVKVWLPWVTEFKGLKSEYFK
jgi:hypothetical protein